MKNTIVFIFLLFSISAFSQQNKWDVGIVGGPSITAIRFVNYNWSKPKPNFGFYAGLSGQYNFSEHFAIHTELAFDRKGTKDKITLTAPDGSEFGKYTTTNQLNFLTLPVHFRASVGNKIKYFLQAGPYLSYLLNQTMKYSSTSINDPLFNNTTNTTLDRPRMDFGISAGLGLMVPVNEKISISGELRGNYGLVNLLSKNNASTKQFNESLNLLIGVTYKLGK